MAREVHRGWVNLEIPPLEQWEESLRWLSRRQRERIGKPAFFYLLQRAIPPAAATTSEAVVTRRTKTDHFRGNGGQSLHTAAQRAQTHAHTGLESGLCLETTSDVE